MRQIFYEIILGVKELPSITEAVQAIIIKVPQMFAIYSAQFATESGNRSTTKTTL